MRVYGICKCGEQVDLDLPQITENMQLIIDKQSQELAELRDITERLPVTADGVPVVPGMRVFMVVDSQILCRCVHNDQVESGFASTCPSTLKASVSRHVKYCYSTREAASEAESARAIAAEAAREE